MDEPTENNKLSSTFSSGVVKFALLFKVVLTFASVDEIFKCDHLNECARAVLSCVAGYFSVTFAKLNVIFLHI